MRIAVIGAGAVGGYFGGRLAHAGEDVIFLERGRTLKALREEGLHLDSVEGKFDVVPAQATDDPKSVGAVDAVLIAVKGWQVPGAIETIRPMLGPETFVVPLMDGIEAPDQLAAAFGRQHVAAGLAVMLGSAVAPGCIHNTLPTSITIGELDGEISGRMERLRNAFERAGVTVAISSDILRARWEKLILVGPWSAVGAVTRAPLGVVRTMPETRLFMEETMREVVTVALARGSAVSDDIVKQSLAMLDGAPASAFGNMRDILDGRPSELETEVGAVVRLAKALGVDAPHHKFLYASLLPRERKARGEIEFPASREKSPS